jgi:hypothetical protein
VNAFFKDNRLLLELKTLSLTDIKPYIPATPDNDHYQPHVLPGTMSCWDALQQTLTIEGTLSVDFRTEVYTLDTRSLMTAISLYKQSAQAHGTTTKL